MIFPYKRFGPFLRPVIPVTISHQNQFIGYEVLIDSGADICIIDAQIGELIGVDASYGVVGQRGFFEAFVVILDLQKRQIELQESVY